MLKNTRISDPALQFTRPRRTRRAAAKQAA
jgi:hypothetical protein